MIQAQIADFGEALRAFRGCSEMALSSPKSEEAQEISDRFFALRRKLRDEGLKLESRSNSLNPLEAALFRWAVWSKTAGYTASLNLADPYVDQKGWPDSAAIMTYLGDALSDMFIALEKALND